VTAATRRHATHDAAAPNSRTVRTAGRKCSRAGVRLHAARRGTRSAVRAADGRRHATSVPRVYTRRLRQRGRDADGNNAKQLIEQYGLIAKRTGVVTIRLPGIPRSPDWSSAAFASTVSTHNAPRSVSITHATECTSNSAEQRHSHRYRNDLP